MSCARTAAPSRRGSRAFFDRRLRARDLLLDPQHVAHGAARALDRLADRRRVDPLGLAAGHQHPRPGQRVGDLERQRGALLGVEAGHELVPAVLAQLVHLGRDPLLVGHDEHGEVGLALGACAVELLDRLRLRQPRRLRLEHDAAAGRAGAALDRHHDVAGLAGTALEVPDRVAVVALADRDLVERGVDRLLERAALGGAALGLLRDGLGLLLLRPRALELDHEALHPLAHLPQAGVLLVGRLLHRAQPGALEDRERVVVRIGGELLAQVVPHHAHRLGERGLELVLHRDRRLLAEVLREHPRDVAVLRPERLVELAVEHLGDRAGPLGELGLRLARRLLQLGLHELDVGAGLLPVQDARADLQRVRDHRGGIVTRLDPRPHELDDRRVVDRQPVDQHAVGEDGDAGMAERGCGGFHGQDVAAYALLLTEKPLLTGRLATAERNRPAPSSSSSSSSSCPCPPEHEVHEQFAPQRWIDCAGERAIVCATAWLPAAFCIRSTRAVRLRACAALLRSGSAATGAAVASLRVAVLIARPIQPARARAVKSP